MPQWPAATTVRAGIEPADHRQRCVLPPRSKRPASSPERGNDLPPPDHSITSSAVASSEIGTMIPSDRAVVRLMTNATLVTC